MNVMLNKHHVRLFVLTLSVLHRQCIPGIYIYMCVCVCMCIYKLKLEKGSCMDLPFHEKFGKLKLNGSLLFENFHPWCFPSTKDLTWDHCDISLTLSQKIKFIRQAWSKYSVFHILIHVLSQRHIKIFHVTISQLWCWIEKHLHNVSVMCYLFMKEIHGFL